MQNKLYRIGVAIINTIYLFFYSLSLWSFSTWIRFWFTTSQEKAVTINNHSITIRAESAKTKIVDLYMAVSCIAFGQYTPPGFELNEEDVVIDIGGHIGSFTQLAAAAASNGHVYAYEPDPENYSRLSKNINAGGYKNVSLFQMAVSEKRGEVTFHRDDLNSAESSIYKSGSNSFKVTSTTLSNIMDKNNLDKCNYLKLDCEGAEYDIVFNSPPELFKKVDKIVMECHTPRFFEIKNPAYSQERMISYLSKLGYKVKCVPENAMHSLIYAKR
jgi:FkbM family methyltransferase